MSFEPGQLALLAPLIAVVAGGVILLMLEAFAGGKQRGYLLLVTLAVIAVAMALEWINWSNSDGSRILFDGLLTEDRLSGLADLVFLAAAALSAMLAEPYMREHRFEFGEFYALVLFATVGMMLLACGYDLIALYISLELMALTFYVLVAFTKRERRSNEAGMKYFLLGAFSSGILLYGMSLLYGVTGSTNLGDIARSITATLNAAPALEGGPLPLRPMLLLGMIALAAGLFFKIAAVPFHMWAPDAYEGAPTPVTAFLSTGSKAASFALYARIFVEALGGMRADWAPLLGLVAAITIMVGNWAAVTQTNAKRLLAYSSISNAGAA